MLDWGVPDELDADNDLERYVDWYLPRAIAAVRRETGADEVTLAGYCLGGRDRGALRRGPRRRARAQPDPDGDARRLRRDGRDGGAAARGPARRRRPIDDTGNVPADALYSGFYMQAPTTEIAQKATLLENLWNDEFVEGFQAMAQWSRDHVPFPGAAFRELVERARPQERADDRLDARSATATIDLGDARGERAQRDGRARQRRARRRPSSRSMRAGRRPRPPRGAAAARRPRDVRHRHAARSSTRCPRLAALDHRAQRRAARPEER